MLEMLRNILILTGVLLIVFVAAEYFRTRSDYRTGLLHRIGSILLYGYVKACSAIAYGLEYMTRKTVSVLLKYRPAGGPLSGDFQKRPQTYASGSHFYQRSTPLEPEIRNKLLKT